MHSAEKLNRIFSALFILAVSVIRFDSHLPFLRKQQKQAAVLYRINDLFRDCGFPRIRRAIYSIVDRVFGGQFNWNRIKSSSSTDEVIISLKVTALFSVTCTGLRLSYTPRSHHPYKVSAGSHLSSINFRVDEY